MSGRTPAMISAALTAGFLIVFMILFLFAQMFALNGASERQGIAAMGISLACQGVTVLLAAMLAWRLTSLAITRWNWNSIVAVILAVIAGTFLGGLLSFLALVIAIPIAGIR